ncbi:polymeric immunoglobulin receptor isoform X2 [Pleuronectes platessa]|uniref:polymeric immunoglobulin receptor isoform X2 n=1 Tax=Pleuronectes platessa TaxID=8262 RepID=UPI00232A213B|nr:polymeric immunoglobulin receptor isoform X2 [Pleuronectes platessa]
MNVCYTLICCFFLYDVSAEILTYSANEGETIRVEYPFYWDYGRRMFCRGRCEAGDVLIETEENEARNGRYSIKYEPGFIEGDLSVTITHLSKSDSGTYQCGLGSNSSSFRYHEFQIIVTDAQLDGSSEVKQLYKRSGGDVTVRCFFTNPKGSKYFCREECGETKNVLIQTSGDEDQSGRYSIKYYSRSEGGGGFLFLTITQLISSDSGRYRCSIGEESHRDFEVIVRDVSTTTSPSSSSSFTRSSASPETTNQSEDQTPETTGADTLSNKNLILTVRLTLVVLVVLLSGAALIFCRKRTNRPREAPVETDPASVPEPDPVYEDFRDEGRNPAAVEISPDYSYVKYNTTQPVTAGDDYSFVTAATSQHNADDSSG